MKWIDLRTQVREHGPLLHPYKTKWLEKHSTMIKLMAEGHSSKEIGEILKKSPKTIDARIEEIRNILGANNRVHMIFLCCKLGVI